jgi:Zn-dependent alcohol dehydrogenase
VLRKGFETICSRIPLADVSLALDRMRKGEAARSLIVFD